MMPVTIDPATEAMAAIVDRINSGTTYMLDTVATFTDAIIDPLEEITYLRVDVVCETSDQLGETLTVEDRTSHVVRAWVRAKVDGLDQDTLGPLKLLTRQLFQRLNNFTSANRRVKVWEIEQDPKEIPDKTYLTTCGLFVASLLLTVEVEAS